MQEKQNKRLGFFVLDAHPSINTNEHRIFSVGPWPPEADPEECKEYLLRIWDGPNGVEHGTRMLPGHPIYVLREILDQAGYEEVDDLSKDPRRGR